MKKVRVKVLDNGEYADYVVKMENTEIIIETSDENGSFELMQFAKLLTNAGKTCGWSMDNGDYEHYQIRIYLCDSFKGRLEAVHILTYFNAGEEISLSGIFK